MDTRILAVVALAACVRGRSAGPNPGPHPARDGLKTVPLLVLDTPVRGTTEEPVPYIGAICTGGGVVGKRDRFSGERPFAPRHVHIAAGIERLAGHTFFGLTFGVSSPDRAGYLVTSALD